MALKDLAALCAATQKRLLPVLKGLVQEGTIVEGKLAPGAAAPKYCLWECWEREIERRTARAKEEIRAVTQDAGVEAAPCVESAPAAAFCDYVTSCYRPPEDKRMLVFLQCSVRRPFSSSPSHAGMRRAISTATGCDPHRDFVRCPVHVVVLASKVGPVPYELEDTYPANVRSGGVKHLEPEHYARVKPVLAERMARYIVSHRDAYDHIATFTYGRYGEVMDAARQIAGVEFPVLPDPGRGRVTRRGKFRPRPYWERYWIQLYFEILSWLPPWRRADAEARLREMDIEYE